MMIGQVREMRSSDTLFWLNKMLFKLIKYPAYSDNYLKQARASQIPGEELSRYSEFNVNRSHFMIEIVIIYTIICLKNFYFVYYTVTSVDFNELEANMQPIGDAEFSYTCLVSNCSIYIGSKSDQNTTISLVSELIKLPVFATCKQDWKWLFNPILEAQTTALIHMSDLTFLFFTLSVVLPIYMYFVSPAPHPCMLFSICPLVEMHNQRRNIGQILEKLAYSLGNFTENLMQMQYERRRGNTTGSYISYMMAGSFMTGRLFNDHKGRKIEFPHCDPNNMMENDSNFWRNHLPINRTQWWRQKWIRFFVAAIPPVVINGYLTLVVANFCFAYHGQQVSLQEHSDFLDSLHRANCSLRFHSNYTENDDATLENRSHTNTGPDILELKHIEVQWNWFAISELILAPIVPLFVVTVCSTVYYFACLDLKVGIIELEFLLNLAIDCIELNCAKSVTIGNQGDNHESNSANNYTVSGLEQRQFFSSTKTNTRQIYEPKFKSTPRSKLKSTIQDNGVSLLAPIILERMTRIINFDWPILLIRPVDRSGKCVKGQTEARLVNQEFALDLMNLTLDGNNQTCRPITDLFVNLLEKIHVNYCILKDLLGEYQRGFRDVLIMSCFGNYGLALIAVYFYRNVKDFKQGPVVSIFVLWMVVNFYIMGASAVHANIKKLDHMFWSIVANTANCRDVRVQHFRCIWLKNLIAVGADGSLAVKVHEIRITYVRILQLIFGTATIFALALTKY